MLVVDRLRVLTFQIDSTHFGAGIGYTQNGSEHFMSTFPMLVVDRMRVLTSQFKSTPHVGMGIGCMKDGSEHFKQQLLSMLVVDRMHSCKGARSHILSWLADE